MIIDQLRSAVSLIKPHYFPWKICVSRTQRCLAKNNGVPIRHFTEGQLPIPLLPVPPLQDTLQKYLKSVKPFVSEEEFKVTEDIVQKFGAQNGLGESLQKKLEERAKNTENWLFDWWNHAAYLDFRSSLVVWSSPGLLFPLENFKTLDDQLTYGARVIAGALDFKLMVDEKTIPMDTSRGQPLDMSQYPKLFGTCRIPGVNRDSIVYHGQDINPPQHIVVAHNNHFFKFEVYEKKNKPIHFNDIRQQLKNIVERSTHPAFPVGGLSTQDRNTWERNYKLLCEDKLNQASLSEIQKSIFIVCIDGPINRSSGCRITDAIFQTMHGNGLSCNAGNRWYDKTIQFIIGKKGGVGLTCEHSPIDGTPIRNLINHIIKYVGTRETDEEISASELPRPQRLMFNIPSDFDNEIKNAKVALDSLVSELQVTCFTFDEYGIDFMKSVKLSPDSFIQMAIQLAFYRIHKVPGAQYESASTRKFLHGRTETIRSCSVESVEFCKTMLNANASATQKAMALKSAIEAHKKYATDAVNGLGVDRHLLGLKMAAKEAGMNVPNLFLDVGFLRSSHMRLSTSQVATPNAQFGCFAPVVLDGYGCYYNPRKNEIDFSLSALNSSPDTNASIFRKGLEDSLVNMKEIFLPAGNSVKQD